MRCKFTFPLPEESFFPGQVVVIFLHFSYESRFISLNCEIEFEYLSVCWLSVTPLFNTTVIPHNLDKAIYKNIHCLHSSVQFYWISKSIMHVYQEWIMHNLVNHRLCEYQADESKFSPKIYSCIYASSEFMLPNYLGLDSAPSFMLNIIPSE